MGKDSSFSGKISYSMARTKVFGGYTEFLVDAKLYDIEAIHWDYSFQRC